VYRQFSICLNLLVVTYILALLELVKMMEILSRKEKIIQTLSKCDDIPDPIKHYAHLQELKENFSKNIDKQTLCKILDAIGNEDRLLILDALAESDKCVCEIEAILNKAQSTVSHHLAVLEDAGLIRGWKKGKFTHYSLSKRVFEKFSNLWDEWVQSGGNWC
jgi:ArsR family transcriptional regulator